MPSQILVRIEAIPFPSKGPGLLLALPDFGRHSSKTFPWKGLRFLLALLDFGRSRSKPFSYKRLGLLLTYLSNPLLPCTYLLTTFVTLYILCILIFSIAINTLRLKLTLYHVCSLLFFSISTGYWKKYEVLPKIIHFWWLLEVFWSSFNIGWILAH